MAKKVSKGMATRGSGRMSDARTRQSNANQDLQSALATSDYTKNGGVGLGGTISSGGSPAQYGNSSSTKRTARQKGFETRFAKSKMQTSRKPTTMNNSPKKKK